MNLITNILNSLGWYPTIFVLMLLESTVVPVPSEFVVTPAAYHAASEVCQQQMGQDVSVESGEG